MLHACSYTICFEFCYTSWRFYAFSRTNLLTRCHSVSSLFSTIFVFQKSYTGNILGIGRNKSQTSYFYRSFAKTKDETEGGQRPPGPPPDDAPSPIKSPQPEKPKGWIAFPRNILEGTAIVESRSGGSKSSSQDPGEEGNPCRRPSPPPWSPPEWCVSSLPWTTGP
jgi:hypothetical protein